MAAKINILNLIDFEEVNNLLEGFNKSTGFVTAILDLKGNVLSKSGWRKMCTHFHRVHPETAKNCTISDTVLANELGNEEKYHFYKCLNGLVDVAVPIIIKGEHIANLFSGQFFFEEPNRDYFKKQAGKFGFNEKEYFAALEDVPVVSKEKVKVAMDFLLNMTQLISEMTYQKLEQAQLNEALTKSEERFRGAFDHMLEGCQIIGYDWKYIYLNRSAEIHNRRPNEELLGNRYQDMWPGIEETEVFKIIERVLEKRIPHQFENKFVFPDGRIGWFDLSIQPVPEGVFILSIDISDRKNVEHALRESEEKYRLISDNSDDWIYWIAPDGKLLYVSPACERVTGYSPEEFTKHPELIHEIVFDADKGNLNQHHQNSRHDHTQHQLEYRIITKEGELRWINHSCGPIYNNKGEYMGRRGTNRNITERKLQEQQLFESEFRFNKLYETSAFGMVLTNENFQFIKTNPAFCSIMGYNEAELLSMTFKELSFPEELKDNLANIQKLIRREIPVYKTVKRYIRKDGQVIWGSLTVVANYTDEGNFLYNLATIEDITPRKQAEDEIKLLNERISTATSASQVGIWDWDIQNNVLDWDDQMYQLYGVKKDQFNGAYEAWVNGLHPDDREFGQKETLLAISGEKEYDTEFRVIWPDGSIHFIKAKGEVFRNDAGDPIRMVGVNLDISKQKLAEDKIREKDSEFRKLSANMPDMIYQFTRRADGTYFVPVTSEGIRNIFGCSPEDVLHDFTPIGKVLHPDDAERVIREIEYSAQHLTHFKCEFRVQIPGKDVQWIYSNSTPEKLPDGSITWYGFNVDITQKKLTEEALKVSEEKFRLAFATNPDAITILRLSDGVFISVNNGFTQVFGYSEEEVMGKNSLEIHLWFNPQEREKFVTELNTKGKVENFEARLCTKDGQVKETLVSSISLDFEGLPHILSTIKDISDRKRVEQALRESEGKFRKLIESIPLPVAYTNSLGEITFRNDRFLQILGYTYDEVPTVNEWYIKAYPDETYRQQVIKKWDLAVKNAQTNNSDIDPIEYNITCKNGMVRTMIVSGINIEDNLLITLIDVTDRIMAENEIKELNENLEQRVVERTSQLEAANKEMEAFSYSVSHDLRAPLRHINGYVDLLNSKYLEHLPEKAQHYLNTITGASKQMGTLIDDLLQFSRTGRKELHKSNIDMNMLVDEVLEKVKPDMLNRKITWNVQKLPEIFGDAALLKQVWINLIDNAVKYSRYKETAEISVNFREEKKYFVFYIRDNGVGFDMKYAHKLFGVFQRLHSQTEFEGTGIGLANVQRIIHKHNGLVWAEAEPDKGATFYFSLPKITL